jgi:hypothetical protein
MYFLESNIFLKNVTISNNTAGNSRPNYGGGIYSDSSNINFNSDTLCNIYNNSSYHADDIYSNQEVSVNVDTFTVLYPTGYQVNPLRNFTFSINYGIQEQIMQDLYVSPEGDDLNSGISSDSPLKTIGCALNLVYADSLNPRNISLMEGVYSPTTNEESFPILGIDYITFTGVDSQSTIIDAGSADYAIWLENLQGVRLENLHIKNADNFNIYVRNSNISLLNTLVTNADFIGCTCSFSTVNIENCNISNNEYSLTDYYSSIVLNNSTVQNNWWGLNLDNSTFQMANCVIDNNTNYGLYIESSDFNITASSIVENSIAGMWTSNSTGYLNDVNISHNFESGIKCEGSLLDLSNVSIKFNTDAEYGGGIKMTDSSIIHFDPQNLCSIYSNNADFGKDLFSFNCDITNIILDTSTVLIGTHYLATPAKRFFYDVNTGLIEQFKNNLYVSPGGNNNNSGLSSECPL